MPNLEVAEGPHHHLIHSFVGKPHKILYNETVRHYCEIPYDRYYAWIRDLNIIDDLIHVTDWTECYLKCFDLTTSISLRSFEYSFRMRDVLTNLKLTQIKLKFDNSCPKCYNETDTILHMF